MSVLPNLASTFPVPPHSTLPRQEWQEILGDYTRRKLSHDEDKFPALSAIAEEYHEILQTEYVAGLWKKYLIFELMWIRIGREKATRPSAWRCPSWSWASLNGRIGFKDMGIREFTAKAEVLHCSALPASITAPFGRVKDGKLVLRSSFREVILQNYAYEKAEVVGDGLSDHVTVYFDATYGQHELYSTLGEGNPLPDRVSHSEADNQSQRPVIPDKQVQTWCFILGFSTDTDRSLSTNPCIRRAHGLLLTRAKSDRFQRIGWFQTPHNVDLSKWFEDGNQETVTII
jgi:hypothetical protein